MSDKKSLLSRIWMSIPKSPTQLLVFWLYVHAYVGTKYLPKSHPYKDKRFTLKEVGQGHYMGSPETTWFSLCLWGLLGFLAIYTVGMLT